MRQSVMGTNMNRAVTVIFIAIIAGICTFSPLKTVADNLSLPPAKIDEGGAFQSTPDPTNKPPLFRGHPQSWGLSLYTVMPAATSSRAAAPVPGSQRFERLDEFSVEGNPLIAERVKANLQQLELFERATKSSSLLASTSLPPATPHQFETGESGGAFERLVHTIPPLVVSRYTYQLSTVGNTSTENDIIKFLRKHHVPMDFAKKISGQVLRVLKRPEVKTALVAVAGAGIYAAYQAIVNKSGNGNIGDDTETTKPVSPASTNSLAVQAIMSESEGESIEKPKLIPPPTKAVDLSIYFFNCRDQSMSFVCK
ncbi:MAG: hypothetical protein MN733_09145, partial [Nitrososphaera sp.]|nr:hypothetical protein [Nitrososphaera sp.]